jgi:hypothetical protein
MCAWHDPEDNETFYCIDLQQDIKISNIDEITKFPNQCKLYII